MDPNNTVYKVGAYWRKVHWSSFPTVPIVLELRGQNLILRTRNQQEVFNVPISAITVTIHLWTIEIVVKGKSYYFEGSTSIAGGQASRGFSASQIAEIAAQETISPVIPNDGTVLPSLKDHVAGSGANLQEWRALFEDIRSPYSIPGAVKKSNTIAVAVLIACVVAVLLFYVLTNHY